MISIKSQDALHQYDENGTAITTWCDKRCSWIVNPEFEGDVIDWYGSDSDFAAGTTAAEYEATNPDWKNNPAIAMIYQCNNIDSYAACLKEIPVVLASRYPNTTYPVKWTRKWAYFSRAEIPNAEEAIVRFWPYCGWSTNADDVSISYDGSIIKLKEFGACTDDFFKSIKDVNYNAAATKV